MSFKAMGAIGVAAVLAGGGGWWATHREKKAKNGGSRAVAVELGAIEQTVEATGSVVPLNRVEIKAPISGRINELLVDEGSPVKQGQILAWMSSTDRAAIMDAARAQGPDAVKYWEQAYKATPVLAPMNGVLILRNVVVGQTVDPSLVLYAMSDVLITVAQVDESDIGKIKMGMPARVWLDAYPDRVVEGKVFDILYEGKNVSNVIQYGVKVKMEKVPDFFRSQMTANFSFIVRKKEGALLLPSIAIKTLPSGGSQVLVPGADGKPAPKEIKIGIESGEKTEVVEGLAEGDEVILAQGKYVPQQAAASSPLTFGGARPSGPSGQAPSGQRRSQ